LFVSFLRAGQLGGADAQSCINGAITIPVKQLTELNPTNPTVGYGVPWKQDLGVTPASLQDRPVGIYVAEGDYVLTFSVKNFFPTYPGYYDVSLTFGSQELCSIDGWGRRASTEITLKCPSPGYLIIDQKLPPPGPVQSASDLVLTFSVPGWQLYFTNVSLTFTPAN